MDDKTYKQFCKALSLDVKTRLEHIRSYVHTSRASVMVGAGFSKNFHHLLITKKRDYSMLMSRIRERILFATYEVKEDAALSLGIIQGMQEEKDNIIRKLIDYTDASQGIKTYEYLKIICKLIYCRVIKHDAFAIISEMLNNVIASVRMNAGNENAASEARFKIYELVGLLSVWNADGLSSQDGIKPYLEEKCGLMDEKKGKCIGKWNAERI